MPTPVYSHAAACQAINFPMTFSLFAALTLWRDDTNITPKERYVRRIWAEFGYAGVIVAGLVEGVLKGSLGAFFLCAPVLPGFIFPELLSNSHLLAQYTLHSSGVAFITIAMSIHSLVVNPFSEKLAPSPI